MNSDSDYVACYSYQESRVADGLVVENDSRNLDLYDLKIADLNRVEGAALSVLPKQVNVGIQTLWQAQIIDEIRKRTLESIALLSPSHFQSL